MKSCVLWFIGFALGCASTPETRRDPPKRPAVSIEIRDDGKLSFSTNHDEAVLSCDGSGNDAFRLGLELQVSGMDERERKLYQLTHCLCVAGGTYRVRQVLSDEIAVICER